MMNAALHDICTRIARLETERKELAAEVAAIKKDAKEQGYDAGLITKTVAIMLKSGKKQREALEQIDMLDTYLNAVGLLSGDRIVAVAAERLKPGDPVVLQPQARVNATVSFAYLEPVDLNDTEAVKRERGAFVAKVGAGFKSQPPHDPDTGEITEQPSLAKNLASQAAADEEGAGCASSSINSDSSEGPASDDSAVGENLRSAAGERLSHPLAAALAGSIDMGDIPEALDRRKRQEVAA
jgi:uncharacterized protein (UPF0335 family)